MIGTERQKIQLFLYTLSLVLATAGLVCRLWARKITRTRWQVNDYLMILAYLNVLGLVVAANLAVTIGEMGVRQKEIPLHRLKQILPFNLKMTIVVPFFLTSSSFFAKMSIIHFYIVLFPHTWVQILCKIQFCLLTLSCIASVIPIFLQCQPFRFIWDKTIPGGHCFNIKALWLWVSIVALLFDLACVLLPIPVFWALKTSTKKKIRLTVLFSLGFFICALSVARIYYNEKIQFHDLGCTASSAIMFTVPEPSLGIVAGCLPITVPLWTRASSAVKSTITSRFGGTLKTTTNPHSQRKPSLPISESGRWKRMMGDDGMGAALYPMTSVVVSSPNPSYPSVVVSRYSGEDNFTQGVCPMQLRATEEMVRQGVGRNGITVLREVRIETSPRRERSSFDWE